MFYRDLRDDECSVEECRRLASMDDTKGKFVYPPLNIQPKAFVNKHFGPESKLPMCQFWKGTTTLAFVYKPKTANDKGGVLVAVDSRATGGQYIMDRHVKKIIPIGSHVVATMAGGAADCQFWCAVVSKYCSLFELREGKPITVSAASKYFANTMYAYRNHGLSLGSMIVGYDSSGPSIYLVENDGSRVKTADYVSVGSGSLNAYGVMDTCYKETMSDEEAFNLGKQAIMHATNRDGASGGFCNICHISADGAKTFPPMDVSELFYKFAAEKGIDLYKSFC